MENYVSDDPDKNIEKLEESLRELEQYLSSQKKDYRGLIEVSWIELSQHCYSVNNAMQLFHFGIRNTHEMQVDHILGLCDRFSSVTDTILSNASQCPDALYRRIAHFGVATRIRAKELLLREKRKQRKER